jgi:hypothetical protein
LSREKDGSVFVPVALVRAKAKDKERKRIKKSINPERIKTELFLSCIKTSVS